MTKKFPQIAEWDWSVPAQLNIGVACTDEQVQKGRGKQLAMIVEDDELGTSQYTYQQLADASSRFAAALLDLGIRPQDRILIRLPNALSYPTAFFGSMKMGAVAVPTSTLLAGSEVQYLANDSGARLLVTDKSMWADMAQDLSSCAQLDYVLLSGEGNMPTLASSGPQLLDMNELMQKTQPLTEFANSSSDDAAYLVYTSGTTGFPKGVLHAHRTLYGRLPASEYWFQFTQDEKERPDRILHSGKFNWTYVLGSALMHPLFQGKTVVVDEGVNDATLWPRLIKQHDCTIFIGVPTIYRQIIQKTAFSVEDVPSLRHCMSAGEHLSDEMLQAWKKRFGLEVYEAIGMSEISYYISQNKYHPIRPGSAGFPQPGHDVHLLDESLEEVGVEQEGMICLPESDPGLFIRYWNKEAETAEARHDGWFFTGDFARRDAEGYIWFLGRRDDIINTFGYRVSPHEVERVMKTHPAVANCVALGEDVGPEKTLVSLCVILFPDYVVGKNIDAPSLIEFGAKHLAKYKAPKIIHFMEDFPRTKNGKILRNQLVTMIGSAE